MKSTPKLPASSRMAMPASANKPSGKPALSAVKSGGVSKKIVGAAKGKHGMAMKNKAC